MVSRGLSRVAEVLIINAAFSAMRLVTFAQRGADCCRGRDQLRPFGRVGGELAVWDPPSQWSWSGYQGGRVGEGQLMEIKEETIRDWGNSVVLAGWSCN
jgi:hypothetical protein